MQQFGGDQVQLDFRRPGGDAGNDAALVVEDVIEGYVSRDVADAIASIDGVKGVHHLHVRSLSEHDAALECHVTTALTRIDDLRALRDRIGVQLRERFSITHATVEFEPPEVCRDEAAGLVTDE